MKSNKEKEEKKTADLTAEDKDQKSGSSEDASKNDVIPTEKELADMSAEERRALYEKLTGLIGKAVEDGVSSLGEKYKRGLEQVKETNVKQALAGSGKFSGFGESIAAIDEIIDKLPVLKELEPSERYTVAYLINEGIKARRSAGEMTAEALAQLVLTRPDAMRLIEAKRAKELSDAYKTTPAFAASGGSASMPANVKNMPRNLDEARDEAYNSFGIRI